MAKRFIVVPPPVEIMSFEGNERAKDDKGQTLEPVTFSDFVKKCLFADPRWLRDLNGLNAREAVLAALAEDEHIISLAEEDWKYLEGSIKSPQHIVTIAGMQNIQLGFGGLWSLGVMPQFMGFMRAIVNATTTKPDVPKGEAA